MLDVVVMCCYARSGGTLLNRILGVLPNTIVISEVNPLGGGYGKEREASLDSIPAQAKGWYDYTVTSQTYGEQAAELASLVDGDGKVLVIRDWPYVNFHPHPYNGNLPPQRLLIFDEISRYLIPRPFALVRDAVDVWASCGKQHNFFSYYLKYIEAIVDYNMPIVKYEDLCANPEAIVRRLCASTGLVFSNFANFYQFSRVNGDTQLAESVRKKRGNPTSIELRPRREITSEDVFFLDNCKDFQVCQSLLGYSAKVTPVKIRKPLIQVIQQVMNEAW
ncbi:MAG: hypothetical protein AB7D27_05795 [Desulfomicrobium sp.]